VTKEHDNPKKPKTFLLGINACSLDYMP